MTTDNASLYVGQTQRRVDNHKHN